MDRFNELAAFIAVVEASGFSAAARTTGDSQSAVSKAIGALERRLGVRLFNRSTRKVTLTDEGRRYYDRIKPLLDEMQDADNELTESTLSVSGRIRIAASGTFGRLHVLPLIPDLLSLNPGLQVDLILSDFVRDRLKIGSTWRYASDPSTNQMRSSGASPSPRLYASDLTVISSATGFQRRLRSSASIIACCMAA